MAIVGVVLFSIGLRGLALLVVMLIGFIPTMAVILIMAIRVVPSVFHLSGPAVLSLNAHTSVKDADATGGDDV
jgi:hypothetical protein